MSLLNRISFYRANLFLLSSSRLAELVMWLAKRLQRPLVIPDEVWLLEALRLRAFVEFYLFLNAVPISPWNVMSPLKLYCT